MTGNTLDEAKVRSQIEWKNSLENYKIRNRVI